MYVAESKRLTHQGAKKIMATAVRHGQPGRDWHLLRDRGCGHLILFERMDGGRFHTVYSCITKAVCAASNRRPTTAQGAAGQDLDVSLRSVLRSPPDRSDGRPWKVVCRC